MQKFQLFRLAHSSGKIDFFKNKYHTNILLIFELVTNIIVMRVPKANVLDWDFRDAVGIQAKRNVII